MSESALAQVPVEYSSSDGQPMAENDWQLRAMIDAISALDVHFRHRPDVYVSGDLLIYHEEGNPGARVAPDVFVVLGAAKHERMTYKLWEEPKAPDFVMEVASPKTWRRDADGKRKLYAELGVREYWQFDPRGDLLSPPLQGLRLHEGVYRPLPARGSDGTRVLPSEALGLDLRVEGGRLRFRDPVSGEDLRTLGEAETARREEAAARRESEIRLAKEAAARRAAEARVLELQARLDAASGKSEP